MSRHQALCYVIMLLVFVMADEETSPSAETAPDEGITPRPYGCGPPLHTVNESQWAGYVDATKMLISCYNATARSQARVMVSWQYPTNIGSDSSVSIESYHVHYAFENDEHPSSGYCKPVPGNDTFHILLYEIDGLVWDLPISVLVVAQPSPRIALRMFEYSSCAEGVKMVDTTSALITTAALRASSSPPKEKLLLILIGVAGTIITFLLIVIFVIRRPRKLPRPSLIQSNRCLVYISYYPDSAPFIDCVLNFAGRLRSEYGVQVEIDAWSRREIDAYGIALWCERMHTNAEKIVIIFSPKYLEVYDAWLLGQADPMLTDENKLRVCADIEYVKSDIYRRGQRNDRCIYVTAGARNERLAELVNGRPLYKFPQSEDEYRTLCFAIEGKEQISIPEYVNS